MAVFYKCVRVLNDGTVKRFVLVRRNQKEGDDTVREMKSRNRLYRETYIDRVNISDITLNDCSNNTIQELLRIEKLIRMTTGDDYVSRNDVIELIKKLSATTTERIDEHELQQIEGDNSGEDNDNSGE